LDGCANYAAPNEAVASLQSKTDVTGHWFFRLYPKPCDASVSLGANVNHTQFILSTRRDCGIRNQMDRIISPIEIKASPNDDTIIGYAAIFNHPDSDQDVILPGAFKKTIQDSKSGAKAWPVFLLQHSSDDPIGSIQSMEEDENGLLVRAKIAPTTRGKEILSLLKMKPRPAMSALGVGFRTRKFTANKSGRTLTDLDLVAVSLCTFPSPRLATVTSVKRHAAVVPPYTLRDQVRDDWAMLGRTITANNRSGW
jgi:HK97 family phage prohead protease